MSDADVIVQHVGLQRLDAEKFKPYGMVLSEDALSFPEFDPEEGRIAFEMFKMRRSRFTRESIGFHFSYTQPIIVLKGKIALIVAPPPRDPKATLETAEVDYDRVAAFEIQGGEGIVLGRGVWHDFVGLDDQTTILHLVRRLTSERFSSPAESINMRERDNHVIVLEPAA